MCFLVKRTINKHWQMREKNDIISIEQDFVLTFVF